MPPTYLFPEISAEVFTGHAPLTIKFEEISSSNPATKIWEWDFNNDGHVDSYEQNPSWTFEKSGKYKVSAVFKNDSLTRFIELEDSIEVFEGESSLKFENNNSMIKM